MLLYQYSHLIHKPVESTFLSNNEPLKVRVIFRIARDIASDLWVGLCLFLRYKRAGECTRHSSVPHSPTTHYPTHSTHSHSYIIMGIFGNDSEEAQAYDQVSPHEPPTYCTTVEPLHSSRSRMPLTRLSFLMN